ncbi:hypothetical protein TRVL_08507 [Trypanosoma vivax]|nr:hypothetical protein TRVL_08507 [Trypanosoma vivax]
MTLRPIFSLALCCLDGVWLPPPSRSLCGLSFGKMHGKLAVFDLHCHVVFLGITTAKATLLHGAGNDLLSHRVAFGQFHVLTGRCFCAGFASRFFAKKKFNSTTAIAMRGVVCQ